MYQTQQSMLMGSPVCPIIDHHNAEIHYICMDLTCKQQLLCVHCSGCHDKYHNRITMHELYQLFNSAETDLKAQFIKETSSINNEFLRLKVQLETNLKYQIGQMATLYEQSIFGAYDTIDGTNQSRSKLTSFASRLRHFLSPSNNNKFKLNMNQIRQDSYYTDAQYTINLIKDLAIRTSKPSECVSSYSVGQVDQILISPDSQSLAITRLDNAAIELWRISTKELIKTYTTTNTVESMIFSSKGSHIVYTDLANEVKQLQLGVDQPNIIKYNRNNEQISTLACIRQANPEDSQHFIGGGRDKQIFKWNIVRPLPVLKIDQNLGIINSIAANDCGVAALSVEGKLGYWNLQLQFNQRQFEHQAHQRGNQVCFYQDLIVTGGFDYEHMSGIKLWNKSGVLMTTLEGHTQCILTIMTTQRFIISSGEDKQIIIFDLSADKYRIKQVIKDHVNNVILLHVPDNQQQLISCSDDGIIKIWNL